MSFKRPITPKVKSYKDYLAENKELEEESDYKSSCGMSVEAMRKIRVKNPYKFNIR